jgi:hypothetical protein
MRVRETRSMEVRGIPYSYRFYGTAQSRDIFVVYIEKLDLVENMDTILYNSELNPLRNVIGSQGDV